MSYLGKDKRECLEAYDNYKPVEQVGGLTISTEQQNPTRFTIPNKPESPKKIDNYGLAKKDRKFKPIPIPDLRFDPETKECLGFVGLNEDEELELIKRLYEYRTKGYWFYRGDQLEYITGDHWYYLNVIKIDVVDKVNQVRKKFKKLPNFVDSDRDFFYFWREAEIDPFCFGMVNVTNRRDGKTSRALSILMNAVTSTFDACCGIQAQNSNMAKSIFRRAVRMWEQLPQHDFFYPEHSGEKRPSTILKFEPPATRSTKQKTHTEKEALYSWLDYRSTTEHAYDGEGMYRMFIDEASKIEGCDINELFNVVRETMADGAYATGKMIMTSTAENIGGKTLPQFERMCQRSDVSKRNELGQTASGLFFYFKPAYYGYRYDPEDGEANLPADLLEATIDEWGNSNTEAAKKVILAQRKGKSGDDLIQFIRKYPFDINEAFSTSTGTSPFSTEKINEQLKFNRDLQTFDQLPVVRGNFNWIGERWSGKVRFDANEKGRWLVSMHPHEEDRCRIIKDLEGRHPSIREFYTGIDPYDNDMTVEEGSDGAAFTWCNAGKYTDRIVPACVYMFRPPTVEELAEDFLKQCCYYSSYAMIENQRGQGVLREWKRRGFGGFILKDPLKDVKTDGFSTRSEDTRDTMINKLRTYIYENVGKLETENGSVRYGHFPFIEVLEEFRKFESKNWTPYDITVAAMAGLHGIPNKIKPLPKISLDDLVPTFDNTGTRSSLDKKRNENWDWF